MIGETIGSYTVLSEIGRGGMGVVFLAQHKHLGRKAAIKLLLGEYNEHPQILARFFDEARATSAIDHPGIVQIHDCDVHSNGRAYIVMEFLEGETLHQRLTRVGPFAISDMAAFAIQIADALGAAHEKGIVHRDLKPDNIFIANRPVDHVKILDFGIAKLLAGKTELTRTSTGTLMGTPLYMSPEQCRGSGRIDHRSDLYSLGCVIFQMLTGRPPFNHDGHGELIVAHVMQPPPLLSDVLANPPGELSLLLARLLAKEPAERPAHMHEVIMALRPLYSGRELTDAGSDPIRMPFRSTAVFAGSMPNTPIAQPSTIASKPAAPPSTTFRAYSGESSDDGKALPTKGSNRIAIYGLIGGGIVALAVFLALPGKAPPPIQPTKPALAAPITRPEPPVKPAETPPPPVAPTPLAVPPVPVATIDETPPKPTPAKERRPSAGPISITVTSTPPGAEVCRDGERRILGKTDGTFEVRVPGGKGRLMVYRRGFRSQPIKVTGEPNQKYAVKLRELSADDLIEDSPCR